MNFTAEHLLRESIWTDYLLYSTEKIKYCKLCAMNELILQQVDEKIRQFEYDNFCK
jgi:hypothetical protein